MARPMEAHQARTKLLQGPDGTKMGARVHIAPTLQFIETEPIPPQLGIIKTASLAQGGVQFRTAG